MAMLSLSLKFLKILGEGIPGLLQNPNRIWNVDETGVDGTRGKREKRFTDATSHHGCFRAENRSNGLPQHIISVIAVSASGRAAPPLFIIAARRMNPRWWEPVTGQFRNGVSRNCAEYTRPNRFPREGVIMVSENGSMEMDIMPAMVKHINKTFRSLVHTEPYLFCLDGDSSRKGVEWIEECKSVSCEAVISPGNISHFL